MFDHEKNLHNITFTNRFDGTIDPTSSQYMTLLPKSANNLINL